MGARILRARKMVLARRWTIGPALALLVGWGWMIPAPASADDAEARAAIVKLLDVGWKTTPQARLATNAQYVEVLKLVGRADERAARAAMLVLMQQRRYDDVPRQIEVVLTNAPNDLPAWRAKVWVLTLLKNYSQALIAAEKLGEFLPAETEGTNERELEAREYVAFLGRIFGYLGGPLVDAANQEQRKAAERKLVDSLSDARRATFVEARDGVLQRFIEMSDAKDEQREKAKAAAETEKEKTLQEVAAVREQNQKRLDELKYERDKINSELKEELAEIGRVDQPLVTELARLSASAATINRNLFNLDQQIGILQAQAAREKDPNLRALLFSQIDSLQFQYSRVQGDLAAVERLAAGVNAQRQQLAARQQQAQNNAAGQMSGLDKEYQGLVKSDKRATADERRAGRPAATLTSSSLALGATALALSTYDQYPLDEAKAKLLDSLAAE